MPTTVVENLEAFLVDRPHKLPVRIRNINAAVFQDIHPLPTVPRHIKVWCPSPHGCAGYLVPINEVEKEVHPTGFAGMCALSRMSAPHAVCTPCYACSEPRCHFKVCNQNNVYDALVSQSYLSWAQQVAAPAISSYIIQATALPNVTHQQVLRHLMRCFYHVSEHDVPTAAYGCAHAFLQALYESEQEASIFYRERRFSSADLDVLPDL